MIDFDELLAANARYAKSAPHARLPARPARGLAIVTCMDVRIDPLALFGLADGDAHVIRNAGGRMAEALRSLSISQLMLRTEAVALIHHTDCGLLNLRDDEFRLRLRKAFGAVADHVAFLSFTDLQQSVQDDLTIYRESRLVRHDIPVRGYVYDVDTARLREVASLPPA